MKKFLFLFTALCATQVSFGMESDQNDLNEALSIAIEAHDLEQVKSLLAAGADPNSFRKKYFSSHLLMAVKSDNVEICQALLDAGADVNLSKHNKFFPLGAAIFRGKLPMIKLLLVRGANINQKDCAGLTPLIHIFWRHPTGSIPNSLQVCELLLQHGADDSMREKMHNETALDHARKIPTDDCRAAVSLLSDPEKIHAVIMRADNPNLKKLRGSNPNICNALMNRELGMSFKALAK